MKFIHILTLLSLMVIFLSSCGNKTNDASENAVAEVHEGDEHEVAITPAQIKMAQLEVGNVEMKALSGTIKVNGLLDVPPQNLVSVSTPFGGFIKKTELLQGMKVKKGEALVTLEHPDFIQLQQDYLDQKSQLDYLKLEYERQEELSKENINSQKTLQKSKSEYLSMEARVMGLAKKLEMMNIKASALEASKLQSTITIYSPLEGYVTVVNTNIGAYVNPTDVLFKIVDTEHLHVELTVFEKDVPKLKIGQKVRFMLSNESEERTATVYLVGKEIGLDRTVRVHCHLDNEDKELIPGMYIKALVETHSMEVAALPEKSVVDFQGTKYVFAMEENVQEEAGEEGAVHFEMIAIKTGVTELGFTEVIFPESFEWQNKKFAVNGAYDLLSISKNGEASGHVH